MLTSPPYWTLKQYRPSDGQMGHIEKYDEFLAELDKVWKHCYRALAPGGRLICVVGDVCLSRRKNHGRHTVVPLPLPFKSAAGGLVSTTWRRLSGIRSQTRSTKSRMAPAFSGNPTNRTRSSKMTSSSS
ncbi:MAG: DNA methyltransferase [Terriglobia bacterium]